MSVGRGNMGSILFVKAKQVGHELLLISFSFTDLIISRNLFLDYVTMKNISTFVKDRDIWSRHSEVAQTCEKIETSPQSLI
jgi:hypothetical protein